MRSSRDAPLDDSTLDLAAISWARADAWESSSVPLVFISKKG